MAHVLWPAICTFFGFKLHQWRRHQNTHLLAFFAVGFWLHVLSKIPWKRTEHTHLWATACSLRTVASKILKLLFHFLRDTWVNFHPQFLYSKRLNSAAEHTSRQLLTVFKGATSITTSTRAKQKSKQAHGLHCGKVSTCPPPQSNAVSSGIQTGKKSQERERLACPHFSLARARSTTGYQQQGRVAYGDKSAGYQQQKPGKSRGKRVEE